MTGKLHSLDRIRPEKYEMDTVKRERRRDHQRGYDILNQAQFYWSNMSQFRRERERAIKYTYGDQWSDVIKVDGCYMTEGEHIEQQGNVPMKSNHIHKQVTSYVGLYRGQGKEPSCTARDRDEQQLGETASTVLQYNMQLNHMAELNARTFEEFCISGLAVHHLSFGRRAGKTDCWTDYVDPNNFFIDNNTRDFRGWDVSFIGEVHDVSFNDLVANFAKGPEDWMWLKNMYAHAHDMDYISHNRFEFGQGDDRETDFLFTEEPGRCRVIEVWRKESKPRYQVWDVNEGELGTIEVGEYETEVVQENLRRLAQAQAAGLPPEKVPLRRAQWIIDNYWYFYFLSPFGDIIMEGESPYAHKSHPYVFKAYPFINGEIHSFVSNIIDQQKYVNRLITLYDWIIRASAKGVLMFPEDAKPDDMTMEEIADEWGRFNGMIIYKAKPGVPAPQQIANNCTNIGITELLNLQLKFFEDIGINGSLQGKPGWSGMSASLYNQQTQNATTSLLDLLESFSEFVVDGAYKTLKNIQQCYDTKRMIAINGKRTVMYDPAQIKDMEFDISIAESTSTPVYRQIQNDILMKLLEMKAITIEQMLENCALPFADPLLQSIRSNVEKVQQGGQMQPMDPALQQQVQGSANMQAVNTLYGAMTGQDRGQNQAYGRAPSAPRAPRPGQEQS